MRIGYARVSARDQSPDLQIDALRAAGCARIFTEQASGAARDRAALAAALDHAREGDTLVVWKLDRLARSTRQLIETVEDLQGRGVGFQCLTQDGLDTTTPGGRLIFQVFAAIAEFERETIRERTRAGLAAARVRGRVGGRPRALGPEDLDMARVLLRDPDIPVTAIARKLGVSPATLYRALPGGRSAVT
ncbi:recombinase family protein [Jannaschia pohangensis]|uniref:Site-specific DNA recombinase n=1 Tax=Jannaschia pohangensis TaxID=390807 RepID=A0A1I3V4I5_9RHOB|nr:recombinase family protein [Jannaschia pohangensis]SFJ90388.1 Site-specific DNA recombinase [Jannaschia pohangensis]